MPTFSVSPTLRSWVEVDPAALRHNLAFVRSKIGPAPEILAVIKANAYGHGAAETASALAEDVTHFGVANLSEARTVAAAGTGREIVLLSPCLPAERAEAADAGFVVTVSSAEEAAAYRRLGNAKIHFKLDTGMGRVGYAGDDPVGEVARAAGGGPLHSISTHLPSSDEDEPFTRDQLDRFARIVVRCREVAPGAKIHSLNSAGILRFPENAADIVRAGLIVYGVAPLPEYQSALRPALTWKVRVTLVKEIPAGAGVCYGRTFVAPSAMRIAVLAVGYADGFPRHLSGSGATVLIEGKRCALLGRVTMDQIVVDASELPDVAPGTEAVILGGQGAARICAAELATLAGTIPWEILTGIKGRVARIYPDF